MRVRYVGMFDAVLVPGAVDGATGGMLSAVRGEAVEVPDDVAAGLLAQGATADGAGTEWERVDGEGRKGKG